MTKKNLIFIAVFAVVGFAALQMPVAQVTGSGAEFTVYDSFAPIAGGFLGSIAGVVAVFLMQFGNFLLHGAQVEDIGTFIRFLPMLFAVWYFARKGKFNLVIPAIAIVAFIAHPIGRTVWYYSMFWLIPMITYFFRDRFLFARALGSTFTAHAVGGALWIWAFALPAPVWISLIPIVMMERLLFALGMAASFVLVTNLVGFLEKKRGFSLGLNVDQRYLTPSLRRQPVRVNS